MMATISELRQKYPQYSDMDDQEFSDRFYKKFYSDIPREEFNKKIGFTTSNISSDTNKQSQLANISGVNRTGLGLAQDIATGLGQAGQNLASTLTGGYAPTVNMQKTIGPNNPGLIDKALQDLAQYAPFSMGTGLLGGVGRLASIGKESLAGGLYGLTQSPQNKLLGGAEGAGISGGINALTQLATARNPVVNAITRNLINIPKKLGLTTKGAGLETLEHLNESDIIPAIEASKRLGTPITPAEASGNPFVGRIEGQFGRTGESAAEKTRIGLERINKQKNAINDLLDSIYDKKLTSTNKIKDLYTDAYKHDLDPSIVNVFKQDPIIEDAFKQVSKDKAWRRKLSGIPENNFAYLDKVKKVISNEESKLLRAGENEKSSEYTDARNKLLEVMDSSNPNYKIAREEAQKSIIRSQLQKSLNTSEIKGTNFYNKILRNENKFNDLINSLKNVPEAQSKLRDMRLAWKNLINVETPRAASGKAETSMSAPREAIRALIDIFHEVVGSKRNLEALKFIHSGEWEKQFKNIASIKDKQKRTDELINMLGRLTSSQMISNSQGREDGNFISTSTGT